MADYELWLTDDAGRRMALLTEFGEPAFFSYTRAVNGLGTASVGIPYVPFFAKINPPFQPDWRIEIWRSAAHGIPMRREDVYMLRKPNIYSRADGMQIIHFYGRNGYDLLRRRSVIQRAGTSHALKTDNADDMMKAIVREQMVYGSAVDEDGVVDNSRAWPQYEFTVDADLGLGPSITLGFHGKSVIDVLKDIKANTFQLNLNNSSNRRIFFSVEAVSLAVTNSLSPLGWVFRTRADLFGTDRTSGIEFSEENENIQTPSYAEDHLDEFNTVIVNGNGSGASMLIEVVTDSDRVNSSRWNRCEKVLSASNQATTTALQNAGYSELDKGKPKIDFPVIFLNTPGSRKHPRSMYGLDWDLGDLLRVNYAKKQFDVECTIVYVSVDENGKETITGRNEVSL